MKRLLDSPYTPTPKQPKLETFSLFDELMENYQELRAVIQWIAKISPF